MKITEEKIGIILKVIELNDQEALDQIREMVANKSSVPLKDSEKENIKHVLKDLEEGRKTSYGGLFPDYV